MIGNNKNSALPLDTRDRLEQYVGLLLEANRSMNLIGMRDRDAAWDRLVLDSLNLGEYIPARARVLDIGTGGGVPGIPLAIVRPDIDVVMLDATGRKVAFVQSVIEQIELGHALAAQGRAEEWGRDPDHRGRYDAIVFKAVAAFRVLVELGAPFLKVGGVVLALKGAGAERELRDAAVALDKLGMAGAEILPVHSGENQSRIIRAIQAMPAPKRYPRRTGMPAKRPL